MGRVAAAQWKTLALPAAAVLLGGGGFVLCAGRFNLMMMGDDEAAALGLRVKGFRTGMLLLCSVMVASLVSVTGVIGFVGLVVPHVVRLLAGSSDNRVVLPLSGLLGAVYLMWADALARSGFGAAELPLGVITAFVGAPFFLFLMLRSGWRDGVR